MLELSQSGIRKQKHQAGFSLIELLIVVAIILVIAAIAIPNFLRARMAANEAAAVQNCRTITSAEVIYYTTFGVGFAPALTNLGGSGGAATPAAADLIDPILVTGTKSGYVFTYVPAGPDVNGYFQDYALNSDPLSPSVTGTRHFYTNEPAVIRWNLIAVASATDPPLQ